METKPVSPAGASTETLENVTRSVARDGTSHVVTLELDFSNPPEAVWAACTTTAGLARWFEPLETERPGHRERAEHPEHPEHPEHGLAEGGRYRLTESGTSGTVELCQPAAELRITWEYEGDVSRVAVTLEPIGTGTRLALHHVVPDNEHWAEYGPAATGIGWDSALLALSLALSDPSLDVRAAMAAFDASEECEGFVASAADHWCRAHLSAGADPDDAHESAGRTAAFYSGNE